ncbi:MAG: hypothetical protein U0361_04530 [Nitrospiraceae bacterium]
MQQNQHAQSRKSPSKYAVRRHDGHLAHHTRQDQRRVIRFVEEAVDSRLIIPALNRALHRQSNHDVDDIGRSNNTAWRSDSTFFGNPNKGELMVFNTAAATSGPFDNATTASGYRIRLGPLAIDLKQRRRLRAATPSPFPGSPWQNLPSAP